MPAVTAEEHRRAGACLDLEPGGSESRARAPRNTSALPGHIERRSLECFRSDNLSESTDEYFSDGLTEDLIHALSLQSFYRVLSRNSTFSFKGKGLTPRLIAREIDAAYLIQGSVDVPEQKSRHRRTDRSGERRAIMGRPV